MRRLSSHVVLFTPYAKYRWYEPLELIDVVSPQGKVFYTIHLTRNTEAYATIEAAKDVQKKIREVLKSRETS